MRALLLRERLLNTDLSKISIYGDDTHTKHRSRPVRVRAGVTVVKGDGSLREGFSVSMLGYPEVAPIHVLAKLGKIRSFIR